MPKKTSAKKPSFETFARVEPCLPETYSEAILDLTAHLVASAKKLEERLHPRTGASLAEIVRVMNCYYSNLIEGHHTTPHEIESALNNQFEAAQERRNLQVEARAHILVQREIDRMRGEGRLPEPASVDFLRWVHREFYRDASEEMLVVAGAGKTQRVIPGEFRADVGQEVSVGRHIPPSAKVVPEFMERFEQRYCFAPLGQGGRIIAMAASHHRLNFIHPFLDGNGRVSRLMSHAMALEAGIGAHGLWSVSRGLARGIASRSEYKQMMDAADATRRGDLDGRGNLSLTALNEFIAWFLQICLDQVSFMAGLFDLDQLTRRLKTYVQSRELRPEAFALLEQAVFRGSVVRGDVPRVTGLKERTARLLLSEVIADGILASDTPKGPVFLRFPLHSVEDLFPQLFPKV